MPYLSLLHFIYTLDQRTVTDRLLLTYSVSPSMYDSRVPDLYITKSAALKDGCNYHLVLHKHIKLLLELVELNQLDDVVPFPSTVSGEQMKTLLLL